MGEQFVHLHTHSTYSVLDSAIKISELVRRLKELGYDSYALTDHGTMAGLMEFYKEMKKGGLHPILGMEAYVSPPGRFVKDRSQTKHLVLLCESHIGYQNLIRIQSDASINGMYYKPRTDFEMLRKHHEGLIALSACMGGEVQSYILSGDYNNAKKAALNYDEIFGRGNFFLEMQDFGTAECQTVNDGVRKISKETGIPLVCTCDCHYLLKDDWEAHDVLMALQAGTTIYEEKRKIYPAKEFYVKSREEIEELFGQDQEAIQNTGRIASRCQVEIEFGKVNLPPFEVNRSMNMSNEQFLKFLINEGAKERYGEQYGKERPDVVERLKSEIKIVLQMGYTNYFLIVWDFFRFCREGTMNYLDEPINWTPIITGPARGSGAGSAMLYCLGVTAVEPLKFDLLFERFLDPARVSMPDIDSDFEYGRRQEVVDYVVKKYGKDSVANIGTWHRFLARGVVRDVVRALGEPYALGDRISKMIPDVLGVTLQESMEINQDLKDFYNGSSENKKIIDMAMTLEGCIKSESMHAAGVLIVGSEGVTAHVPVKKDKEGTILTQYDMNTLEELGLLKMDFLGLKTLTIINETIQSVYDTLHEKINIEDLWETDDVAPLEMIRNGHTDGVFQLEAGGMTGFMRSLQPTSWNEIIAGISLYRPGPLDYIPIFLKNKRNPESIKYVIEDIEPIVKDTYGVITYQEQCMLIVRKIAGYSASDSDAFRRVISKKKEKQIALHRRWFIDGRELKSLDEEGKMKTWKGAIEGGVAKGYSREALEELFQQMQDFAKYAFNKSHAASYMYISKATAYLKYYYPAHFMSCLLNMASLKQDREISITRYIVHLRQDLGLKINNPSINRSLEYFVPMSRNEINFSLYAKSTNSAVLAKIKEIGERMGEYTSYKDFLVKTADLPLDKRHIDALGAIGAFDELGIKRSQVLYSFPDIKDARKKMQEIPLSDENWYRKREAALKKYWDKIPDIQEFPKRTMLTLEHESAGIYISGHPLDDFTTEMKVSEFNIEDLSYDVDEDGQIVLQNPSVVSGRKVSFYALVQSIKQITTKKKDLMARVVLEGKRSSIDSICFPRTYAKIKDILEPGTVIRIDGVIEMKNQSEPPSIVINDAQAAERVLSDVVYIVTENKFQLRELMDIILKNKDYYLGDSPIGIECGNLKLILSVSDLMVDAAKISKIVLSDVTFEIRRE